MSERESEQNTVEMLHPMQGSDSQETTPIPQEELEEDNNTEDSDGVEVIGNKALCTCTGATDPVAAKPLTVISQQRVLCNGGSLLVATTQDNSIPSITFGTCKLMNNASCAASIAWQNPYTDINILGSLHILTMESQGMCKGATIEFKTSGQSQSVKTSDISGVEAEAASANNPLMNASDIYIDNSTMEAINAQVEETMRRDMEEPRIAEHKEGDSTSVVVNGIVPTKYLVAKQNGTVKQPLGTLCTFKAAEGGTLTWKIRDENMRIIKESVGASEITIQFPKKRRYVIEAYGNKSYVQDTTQTSEIEKNPNSYKNALIVEVSDNEIQLKSPQSKYPVDTSVEIQAVKLFALSSADTSNLEYQVFEKGVLASTSVAEISRTPIGANILFKKSGTYVVNAVSPKGTQISPTDGITIEQLRITGVRINNEKQYKARVKEELDFKFQLNYPDCDDSRVKWRVDFSPTENGTKTQKYPAVNTHITEKPPMSLFTEPGFYYVYAYMNEKSDNVKAVVELTKPLFVEVKWKDCNGNNVQEIGKREAIYANIHFEGVAGLEIQCRLCSLADGVILEVHTIKMTGTILVSKVKLSDATCRQLSEGNKLCWQVACKDTSIPLGNKVKPPKEFPISFTLKEKVTSFNFYNDKGCRESLSIATYGSTIYARVLTRNLTGKSLELYLYRKTPGMLWGTNDIKLYKSESQVNDEGVAIFEIVISNDWKNKGNDSYAAIVTEKGNDFFDDTAKKDFSIGRNLAFMKFVDQPTPDEDGKTLTKVVSTKADSEKTTCPRCKACIRGTEKDRESEHEVVLKDIFAEAKDDDLDAIANIYNKYMNELNMDSCWNKAHFFAQIAVESGDKLRNEAGESFNYYWEDIITKFGAFKSTEGRNKAKEWGRAIKKREDNPSAYKPVTDENKKKIANYAYGASCNTGKELGNTNANDGWNFRGQGLIQITGRSIYTEANKYTERESVDIISSPNEVSKNASIGVLASMVFWDWKGINLRANGEEDAFVICKMVGNNTSHGNTTNHDLKREFFQDQALKYFKYNICENYGSKPGQKDVTKIITYHIYVKARDNGKRIIKKIPSDKNNLYPNYCQYIYYDIEERSFPIGIFKIHEVYEVKHEVSPEIKTIKEGYDNNQTWIHSRNTGVHADVSYYYGTSPNTNTDIYVECKPSKGTSKKRYSVNNNKKIKMLLMREIRSRTSPIRFELKDTDRLYCECDSYAVFLGALGETGELYMCTGNTHKDGTGFPSVSHVNGGGFDFVNSVENENAKNRKMMEAMVNWGCKKFVVGNKSVFATLRIPIDGATIGANIHHNDHLHCGPIPIGKISTMEEKKDE